MINMVALIHEHYLENHGKLVHKLQYRAGTIWNAEDVVQEAYCRALKYKGTYGVQEQDFGAWINKIINNALRTAQAAERRMGMSVEYNEDMDEMVDMLEWEEDMIKVVTNEMDKKSSAVRQVLYLYFFSQYKPREISQVLDISNGYIRTTVKEFKNQLKAKYGELVAC
jgi:RNA polymerase sigma factor (sigma-70 family)